MPQLTCLQSYTILMIQTTMYFATVFFFKLALALFFLRFIVERWARLTIWTITITFCAWTLSSCLVSLFYCGVPTDILQKQLQGQCLSSQTTLWFGIIWGAFNVATDLFFALIPIVFVLRSGLSRATKISAGVVMGIAVAGSCTSIPRIFTYKTLQKGANYWEVSADFLIWSIVEPGACIFAANLATLRPLLDKVIGSRSPKPCNDEARIVASQDKPDSSERILHDAAAKCNPRMNKLEADGRTPANGSSAAWETGLDFMTVKTFADGMDAMERGDSHRS
jgi:hypothetical protein